MVSKNKKIYCKDKPTPNVDFEEGLTHSRPEPEGDIPTEREMTPQEIQRKYMGPPILSFTPEQEKARQEVKAGKLGIKFDKQKTRFDLIPWNEIKQVADVLTLGANKYADDNWKFVPDGKKRYFAAALRHLVAWKEGEQNDTESGISHLAHATCCCLFLMYLDTENDKNTK